ncbi:MAG: hypothetical protein M1830_003102 [Pleopsidium flavum]|nr:MAG: hypothetical protein M1830_003102 [Pleopsidium flavum]
MPPWPLIKQEMREVILTAYRHLLRPRHLTNLRDRRRQYSTATPLRSDNVEVKVGSGGYIALNIHHALANPNPNIILYLPKGPVPSDANLMPEDDLLSSLCISSGSTIVHVHYRLSADVQHQFPKPIHDVLAGYDWVLKHLAHGAVSNSGSPPSERAKNIGVYGELVGGGLAAMLALTESHIGRPGIKAAAVDNPILDWTFPDTVSNQDIEREEAEYDSSNVIGKKKHISKAKVSDSWTAFGKRSSIDANHLLSLRKSCFSNPEQYFDPFASPLLFFRTPGIDIPPEDPPSILLESSTPISAEGTATKRRKAHRKFPPMGSGLVLPNIRIGVVEDDLLQDQGVALADLMRRSIVMHERLLRRDVSSDPWDYNQVQVSAEIDRVNNEAEQRVQLVRKPGVGILGTKSAAERVKEMMQVGQWFRDVLR